MVGRRVHAGIVAIVLGSLMLVPIAMEPAGAQQIPSQSPNQTNAISASQVDLGQWATRAYGSRFGGLWMDSPEPAADVVIGVVSPTAADTGLLQAVPSSLRGHVRIASVTHSRDELVATAKAVGDSLRRATSGSVIVGLDTSTNRVAVALGGRDAAIAPLILNRFGASVVRVTVGTNDVAARVVDGRDAFPPYQAGLRIFTLTNPSRGMGFLCTSGFDVIITTGPGTGLNQGTQAGHCGPSNDGVSMYNTGASVGVSNLSTFYTSNPVVCDCGLIGYSDQSVASNLLYEQPTFSSSVTYEVSDATQGFGWGLCKSGVTSGVGCGSVTYSPPVEALNVQGEDPTTFQPIYRDVENLACGNLVSQPGDSGGPVYQDGPGIPPQAGAAGLMSLSFNDPTYGSSACWATMDEVQRATGTTVRTS